MTGRASSSWPKVCLGDVAEHCLGKMLDAATNKGRPQPYLRNPNVRWFEVDTSEVQLMPFEDHENERYGLRKGDVLVCEGGEAGRAAIWDGRVPGMKFQKAIHRVRPRAELDGRFLVHRLRADYLSGALADYYTGATIKHLTGQDLARYSFPLPEQRRIAAILDQADALRAKRRKALTQLDSLTQSIFIEMFGDPLENPKRWATVALGQHTVKMGSGATPTGGDASYKESGISLIRSLNVRDGAFSYRDLAHIDEAQAARLSNVVVAADDVLLNITGASVARVSRAPSDVLPARVNQHVMIIRPTPTIDCVFLERLLLSPNMKRRLLQVGGSGATREAITKAQAEELTVLCPPIELQRAFATRIQAVESLKTTHREALTELDALFASLQHHAFAGRLS